MQLMRSKQEISKILLILGIVLLSSMCYAKKETIYIPQPYQAYKLCVAQRCEKLFCVISDLNCEREATRSERCKQKNINCQGFFEWEMEIQQDDNTPVPNSLRLCLQQCPPDRFESENFYEIEECNFNCAFNQFQKSDL